MFTGEERRVKLEGEAYFEVAHNRDKPFIVATGGVEIQVLGTSFNVQNYEQDNFSRVSLLEGSLQVYDLLAGSAGIILRPNEEVTIRNGEMHVAQMPDTDYFLWTDGIYSFTSEELGSILKKLELYYDVEIIVKEPSMLKWQYTVKFRQRDGIGEILRLLQKIHPFHMQKDERNNRIILDK
jgi:ferric-dicitrate binding protein FerR (iron transport regulator)